MMYCRGVRGATTVENNTREEILSATKELLTVLANKNDIIPENIVSVIFTMTTDLNAEFPALGARELGWVNTALMCMQEIPVPGSQPRCIRVLLHLNTEKSTNEIRHVYLRDAVNLRPNFKVEL